MEEGNRALQTAFHCQVDSTRQALAIFQVENRLDYPILGCLLSDIRIFKNQQLIQTLCVNLVYLLGLIEDLR